ncbi:hypothetical protein [Streptomyces sp. M92]|uniref:hypothetical protein n=1 Tax=Streptomyces sp. M92 TaxID=2944250 RepID=UPI003FA6FD36|nr:hypothetical protein M6G08_26595 [Streptomyces sp. M92]
MNDKLSAAARDLATNTTKSAPAWRGPPSCPATGINEQAVISYLVTADCTAAALLPDVLGVMTEADRG